MSAFYQGDRRHVVTAEFGRDRARREVEPSPAPEAPHGTHRLAWVVIAVIFVRGERWDSSRKLGDQDGLDGHVEFIRGNRDLGVVIEGAPFHDPDTRVTDDLVGLALLSTDSLEEARRLVETDPIVRSGAFAYRLYPWWDAALRC